MVHFRGRGRSKKRSTLRPFLTMPLRAPTFSYFSLSAPTLTFAPCSDFFWQWCSALRHNFEQCSRLLEIDRENFVKSGNSVLRAPTHFFFCAPRSRPFSKIAPRSRTPNCPHPFQLLDKDNKNFSRTNGFTSFKHT